MSSTLYTNINSLITNDLQLENGLLGELTDAAFVEQDGYIKWVGSATDAPECDKRISLEGKAVLPGFVDSHAHLVFAGDRAKEFSARMNGEEYSAGGILLAQPDQLAMLNLMRASPPKLWRCIALG